MKKWSRKKRWLVGVVIGLLLIPVLFFGAGLAIGPMNLFHAHEHCIKNTGLALRIYAGHHEGRFPFHTNGFGDAVLLLLAETGDDPRYFTAPGDDASLLKECQRSKADVPEERCTRAYVQGLSEASNPNIALVFDRYPTRGGDHFRRPWGPLTREVALLDGSAQFLREEAWPAFQSNQIELLVLEGFDRAEAGRLYAPPAR